MRRERNVHVSRHVTSSRQYAGEKADNLLSARRALARNVHIAFGDGDQYRRRARGASAEAGGGRNEKKSPPAASSPARDEHE